MEGDPQPRPVCEVASLRLTEFLFSRAHSCGKEEVCARRVGVVSLYRHAMGRSTLVFLIRLCLLLAIELAWYEPDGTGRDVLHGWRLWPMPMEIEGMPGVWGRGVATVGRGVRGREGR